MAKDGTNRGGRRVKAGSKPDALADKITRGAPARRMELPDFTDDLTDGVYCEEHAKVMEQHYEKFQRGYSPGKRYGRAWKRIRDRYVHKHPLCEQCLKEGRYVAVEEVHHIVPLAEGGSNDESNLMSLCRSCHEKIHHERGDR